MGGWIGKARQARLVVARLRGSLDSKVRFPSTRALSYLQRGRIKGEQPVYGNATIDAHMSEFSCQIVTDRPRSAVMRLGAVSSPTIPFFSRFPGKFFHSSSSFFFFFAGSNKRLDDDELYSLFLSKFSSRLSSFWPDLHEFSVKFFRNSEMIGRWIAISI